MHNVPFIAVYLIQRACSMFSFLGVVVYACDNEFSVFRECYHVGY